MRLRDELEKLVQWKIGEGIVCKVYAEPWFKEALQYLPPQRGDSNLLLKDLLDGERGGWDASELIQRFGHVSAMRIITNLNPPAQGGGQDTLVFTLAQSGLFSVKKTYHHPCSKKGGHTSSIYI